MNCIKLYYNSTVFYAKFVALNSNLETTNTNLGAIRAVVNGSFGSSTRNYNLANDSSYLLVASHSSSGVEIDIISTYTNAAQISQLANGNYISVSVSGLTLTAVLSFGHQLTIIKL